MERRRSKRLTYNLNAKVRSGGFTYDGSIENVSEGGVEYLLTSLDHTTDDFKPDKIIELNFETPSGKVIALTCEVKWFLKSTRGNKKLTLGMKITNPPIAYKELIASLAE